MTIHGVISAFITQDPYEMIWIESQAAIFVLIVVGLLFIGILKEIIHSYKTTAERIHEEQLMMYGMNLLFSSEKNHLT